MSTIPINQTDFDFENPHYPLTDRSKLNRTAQDSAPNSPTTSSDELLLWQTAAKALGRSDRYLDRLTHIGVELASGQPMSQNAQQSMQADVQAYEQTLENLRHWYRTAQKISKGNSYLKSIQDIALSFKSGVPLSENAIGAMNEDLSLQSVIETSRLILQKLGQETESEDERGYQGKQYIVRGSDNILCLSLMEGDVLLEIADGHIVTNKLTDVDFQRFQEIQRKLLS
jgi:hypothetical protein